MHPRVRLTLIAYGFVFLSVLTGWLVLGAPRAQTQGLEISNGFAGAIRPEIPAEPLDGLRDEQGRALRVPGEVTLVTFLYTTCEDACPTVAQQIRGALDRMDDPPPVIAFSVDPLGDSPRSARAFLADQSLLGRVRFALGAPVALQRQWSVYGVNPQTRRSDHTLGVVLLDARGRQRVGFPGDKVTPEGLVHDVEALRAEGA